MNSNPFKDAVIEVDGDRPYVEAADPPRFNKGDKVYISASGGEGRKGPYLIENVDTTSTPATYTLSSDDGAQAENGNSFGESKLEAA